jgi:hypothetical protein
MLRVGVMLSLGLFMLGIFLFVFLTYRDVSGDPSLELFPVISLIIGLVVVGLAVNILTKLVFHVQHERLRLLDVSRETNLKKSV